MRRVAGRRTRRPLAGGRVDRVHHVARSSPTPAARAVGRDRHVVGALALHREAPDDLARSRGRSPTTSREARARDVDEAPVVGGEHVVDVLVVALADQLADRDEVAEALRVERDLGQALLEVGDDVEAPEALERLGSTMSAVPSQLLPTNSTAWVPGVAFGPSSPPATVDHSEHDYRGEQEQSERSHARRIRLPNVPKFPESTGLSPVDPERFASELGDDEARAAYELEHGLLAAGVVEAGRRGEAGLVAEATRVDEADPRGVARLDGVDRQRGGRPRPSGGCSGPGRRRRRRRCPRRPRRSP